MKPYLISIGVGMLVGIIYALLHVRSPAPPAIALVGLLGMLIGEQVVPAAQRLLAGEPITMAWFRHECVPKITGAPPQEPPAAQPTDLAATGGSGSTGGTTPRNPS
ncbi:XapX domain-containing protein [Ralstonia sp. CHL-2022]|uniref:XapX domain-containing protein n=1 Tax=Ralstonia mojiangensis TaxID=2953895 RepID=A0ABT2L7M5_9RALS|nr:XapX domain-containing protein [Ralstonia mojiangensis]MCT7296185.1 XapX domain-containing protein [Ralstonia mojiangensis]MCT7310658.1 XapX domain-containing protein [Ralstonia mojiangensis]